jgi:CubicO group peptidase (beta-lactamase class C family)
MLVDSGQLAWDDPVTRYLPDFQLFDPWVTREITIRDLLTHRSGLGLGAGDLLWLHSNYSRKEIIRRMRAARPVSSFRSQYAYDNVLYAVAGEIIPAVTGMSWETYVRQRIFKPLGLTSTQWRDDFRRIVKGRAQAYSRTSGQWELEMPFENVHGNGGLLTTVSDLLTWTAMLEHPTTQWKPVVDSLHVRGRLTNGRRKRYAFRSPASGRGDAPQLRGVCARMAVRDYRGHKLVWHTGAWRA